VALTLGPPLDVLARLFRPLIWLLSVSTNGVVRLLGGDPDADREQMSGAELRELVSGHEGFGEEERRIVTDVFEAGDRQVREVMLPRTEVDFLDAALPVADAVTVLADRPHSRYPVIDGSPDDVVGFVHVRDLLAPGVAARPVRVGQLARTVVSLPATKPVLASLTELRRHGSQLAIVVDEYGGTAGIVTLEDLVEELIGDIYDEYDVPGEPERPEPHLGVVDGLLNLDDFADRTGIELPEGPYETVAGFVISRLGRLPALGAAVEEDGHRFEVVALDGRRIERLEVSRCPEPLPAEEGRTPVAEGGTPVEDGEAAPRAAP
jgi:putative hemolysin